MGRQWKQIQVSDDLLSIGTSEGQGDVWVTQTERENHFWVLGSTGEGKSKFLEYLIERDIDRIVDEERKKVPKNDRRSCGLCFIDSTPRGLNAHRVLNYCAQVGFHKVFLVDPVQIVSHSRVSPINPFNYDKSYIVDSVDYLKDAFRVLFEVEDESKTAYITTYLTAIFTILHYAGLTLKDLIYFTLPLDPTLPESREYQFKRDEIYELVRKKMESPDFPKGHREIVRKHLAEAEFALKNIPNFTREFGSTARRINTLVNNPNLSMIFGHRKGVNFEKLVSDGWVILVNASTGGGLGTLQTRLMVTVVINQIIAAIERMIPHGFNKPYYLYLDEAQRYATDKLIEVLDVKRNIKLRLILSHHFPGQFKPRILKSIKDNAKTKIAFYVGGKEDRAAVANEMYGGQLNLKDVEYALSQQEKRMAVMKLDKAGSVIAKTHDTPDVPPNKEFLEKLLNHPNYATVDEILKDYDDRYPSKDTQSPQPGEASYRQATRSAAVPGGARKRASKGVPPGNKAPAKARKGGPIKI